MFNRGVKGYKLWDSEDRKMVLRRDATFDEAFMMKSPSFQHVDNSQTKGVLQWVESDVSPHSPDSFVSIKVPYAVT